MLKDRRMHSTIPVSDLERARTWYADKLGLEPVEESPGGLFYECAGGTKFLLFPSPSAGTAKNTAAGWAVPDIEAEVAELRGRGVVFDEYDTPALKTVGGIATTGPVRAAWFKDSEGNTLGVVQLP